MRIETYRDGQLVDVVEVDDETLDDPIGKAERDLVNRLRKFRDSNRDYLALDPPTNAQTNRQVAALTRQVNALIGSALRGERE